MLMEEKNKRYNKILDELNQVFKNLDKCLHCTENTDRIMKIHTAKLVKYALLAKYRRLVLAIAKLDLEGLYDEAKILIRSLYEMMITFLYCNMNKIYYERYEDYGKVSAYKTIKFILDKSLLNLSKEMVETSSKQCTEYISKYGKKTNSWNGITLAETMEEVALFYKDDDIKQLYLNAYKLNCEDVHTNYNSLIKNFLIIDSDGIKIKCTQEIDENYNKIINIVERITSKLQMVDFKWNNDLY